LEAFDLGLAGVVLSNHGGRQLDFARSGIEILVEVVEKLKQRRGLTFPNERFQLFVDGGVRRASDVLKAVALGATAGQNPMASSVMFLESNPGFMKWGLDALFFMPIRHMAPKEWTKHYEFCMYATLPTRITGFDVTSRPPE